MSYPCEVTFALGNPRKSRSTGNGVNTAKRQNREEPKKGEKPTKTETTRKPGQGENHKDEGKQGRDQEKREEAADGGKDLPRTSLAERAANPTPAYARLHLHVGMHSG